MGRATLGSPRVRLAAVPVLLHLTATRTPPRDHPGTPEYRAADRHLPPDRLAAMLAVLDQLSEQCEDDDDVPWPLPITLACHAVRTGTSAALATRWLWPHYLRQVRTWLTWGQDATTAQRTNRLATAHTALIKGIPR